MHAMWVNNTYHNIAVSHAGDDSLCIRSEPDTVDGHWITTQRLTPFHQSYHQHGTRRYLIITHTLFMQAISNKVLCGKMICSLPSPIDGIKQFNWGLLMVQPHSECFCSSAGNCSVAILATSGHHTATVTGGFNIEHAVSCRCFIVIIA